MEPSARGILEAHRSVDPYHNVNFDLTTVSELENKTMAKAIRTLIPEIMEKETKAGMHVITVRYNADHHRMGRLVKDCKMVHHSANNIVMLKKCLSGHDDLTCTYPRSKTLSVGIMGVIFNEDCTEFVSVEETMGYYTGPKPITGTVDHEVNPSETPLTVFAREVKEETNVNVDLDKTVFGSVAWTPCFRDKVADVNFMFATRVVKSEQKLVAQESEVRNVRWLNVDEFLKMKLPVKHNKPLLLQEAVWKAYLAVHAKDSAGKVEKFAWGSGKDNEVYSSHPKYLG